MLVANKVFATTYKLFDEFYDKYDEWYMININITRSERDCIKLLVPHGILLDIGVGSGALTAGLSPLSVGVDPSEKLLFLASRRGFLTIRSFGEELPIIGNYFDSALIVVTICFVNDPFKVLREANRVLRIGGSLIVCFVPRNSEWGQHYVWLKNSGRSIFYRYANFYDLREVTYMLSHSGFMIRQYCSTLFHSPKMPHPYEQPVLGLVEEAGFICVRAEKIRENN